ncbi:MAG TPA: hypothetical protein V6C57_04510 [Coleofasciculaceae cyanobacterium]
MSIHYDAPQNNVLRVADSVLWVRFSSHAEGIETLLRTGKPGINNRELP